MEKIDIHLHLTAKSPSETEKNPIGNGAAMLPHLRCLGIDKGIILSCGEGNALLSGNDDCARLCSQYPESYHWMCNVDDRDPDTLGQRLERYKEQGAVGLGELMINKPLSHPFFQELFSGAQELSLPVLIHISPEEGFSYGVVDEPGLPLLENVLIQYPSLNLIGHSQPFWHEISKNPGDVRDERMACGEGTVTAGGRLWQLFETYPNLWGDLSANSGGCAIMRDKDYGLIFLERFQDRLMFGTDMTNETMEFPLGAWLDDQLKKGSLSHKAYEKIIRRNAMKLFGI